MRGSEKLLRGFNMPAIRRAEIERYACAIDAADTDDFWSLLLAWQWHNPDSGDAVGALMLAAQRMGRTITEAEAELIIEEADTVPKCRKADVLAKYLHLTDKMRTELQIRTIGSVDVSKQQRARRRKEQKRAHKQVKRRKQGIKPRAEYLAANSISRLQPWKAEGISRRTWYYRRKATALVPGQPSTRWRLRQQDVATDSVADSYPLPSERQGNGQLLCGISLHKSVPIKVRMIGAGLVQRKGRVDWVQTCADLCSERT
jgi:hypothetical protein